MGIGSDSHAPVSLAVVDAVPTVGQPSNGSNAPTEVKETHQVTKDDSLDSSFKCVAWKNWVVSKLGRTLGCLAMLPSLPILVGLAIYDGLASIGNGVSLLFRKITETEKPVQKFLPVTENQEPDSSKELADLYIAKGRAAREHKAEKAKLNDQVRQQADLAQRLRDELQQSGINNGRMVRQYQDEKVEQEARLRDQASQVQQLTADLERSKNDLHQAVSEYKKRLQNVTLEAVTQEEERQELVYNHQFLLQQQADTNAGLEFLVQQITTERLSYAGEKTQLESRINQLNNQYHELEIEASGAIDPQKASELKANSEVLALIRTAYENQPGEYSKLLLEHIAEHIEIDKARVAELEEMLESAQYCFLDQRKKLTEEQQKRQSLSRTRVNLTAQIQDARSTNRNLTDEIQSNRANLEKLLIEIEELEEENKQLREKMKDQDNDKYRVLEQSEQKMIMMAEKMKKSQLLLEKYLAEQNALQKSCGKQREGSSSFVLSEAL